jgi:hypothetical protein
MTRALTSAGGNPLLEQGGAGLQSGGSAFHLKMGFSPGNSRCLVPVTTFLLAAKEK